MRLSLVVSLLWIALFLTSSSVSVGENLQLNDEVLGLIVFKSALVDPQGKLESWNGDDESPCAWRSVQCNAGNGRVSEVTLDGLGLSGKIGRGLEKLQSLRMLSLSNNNLTGTINPELGLLQNLQRLNLSKNALSGNIPEVIISNIVNLQFLDLSQNLLSGSLPDNMFINSSSLRHLSLARNHLEGSVPRSLWTCVTLNHVNLSSNDFSGSPDFSGGIFALSRLRTLDLSDNVLSGSVPDGIAALHNLKELVLHGNKFSGSLPVDIGLCPHLTVVDLSSNMLTGTIAVSLQKLNALKFLDLSNNGLTGYLPASMGDMRSLMYLSLSNNKMSGVIPSSLADSSSLSVIRLSGNGFNGTIPASLFETRLDELDLSRNMLMGLIPPVSGNLFETLKILDLSDNNLKGSIPAEMGLLSKLRYLNLSWNQLESSIPLELGYFQNLTVLDLRNNGLIGAIPGDICDSGTLTILQLDENSLTGPIPEEIGNCSSLYLLSLSHNNLSGPIPESMSQLSKLKILKLEVNQLSGEMPKHLSRLENLLIANVSHNRLVGLLPPGGIFQTLDASAIDGNLGICSPLIKEPCKLNVPKPLVLDPNAYDDDTEGRKKHSSHDSSMKSRHRSSSSFFSASAIVAISAAAVIVVGVVMITLLNVTAGRRLSFVDNALESMCSSSTKSAGLAIGKLILFDSKSCLDLLGAGLDTLLNKSNEIGEGVFGTVYKASSLGGRQEGTMLAIKKLITAHTLQSPEDFDREARILGKVRHLNLNHLRGYYWTPQLQLLVSDYAAGGSLQARLHEPTHSSTPALNWPNRFKIVIGTARGLSHLHHSFQSPIIHYNLKPSNILLDEDLNPKICDFGLVRLLDKHVASSRFQNAPGYVAPELACQSLRVNEKCDVYGFGVLILELVTGKRPVEYREDNVVMLSDHVRVLLEQGNVLDCVDKRMGSYLEEEVLPVLKLALVCTSQIPSSRPSMAEVVQILQVIKTPIPNRMGDF